MRSVVRVAGSLIFTTAVATSALTAIPRTAHATSCVAMELSEYAHGVDVAFVGRKIPLEVYADHLDTTRHTKWVIEEFVTVFNVDRVYKGQVPRIVAVHSSIGLSTGASYGWGRSVVVAYGEPSGSLSPGKCGFHVTIGELEEVFGAGYVPARPRVQQAPDEQPGAPAGPASDDATAADPQQPPDPPAEPTNDDATAVDPQQPPDPPAEPTNDNTTAVDPQQPPDDGSAPPDAPVIALLAAAAAVVLAVSVFTIHRRRHRPPPTA